MAKQQSKARAARNYVSKLTGNKSQLTFDYYEYSSKHGFNMISKQLCKAPHLPIISEAIQVLLVLIDSANSESGRCNPSWDYIVENTGRSRGSIAKDLEKLETLGYISKKKINAKKIVTAKGDVYQTHVNYYFITAHLVIQGIKLNEIQNIVEAIEEDDEVIETQTVTTPIEIQPEVITEQVEEQVVETKPAFVKQTPVLKKKEKAVIVDGTRTIPLEDEEKEELTKDELKQIGIIKSKIKALVTHYETVLMPNAAKIDSKMQDNAKLEDFINEYYRILYIAATEEHYVRYSSKGDSRFKKLEINKSFFNLDGSKYIYETIKESSLSKGKAFKCTYDFISDTCLTREEV